VSLWLVFFCLRHLRQVLRIKEAEKCFVKGAQLGCHNCMYELYEMCRMSNQSLALGWLLSAAANGHVAAAQTAAMHCMKRDADLARFWLSKAATPTAMLALRALGKEQVVTIDECLARISAAMAKIPLAPPANASAE
jgi:hypothetical protein